MTKKMVNGVIMDMTPEEETQRETDIANAEARRIAQAEAEAQMQQEQDMAMMQAVPNAMKAPLLDPTKNPNAGEIVNNVMGADLIPPNE